MIEFRKHLAWYTKGLPRGAELREELFEASTLEEVEGLLEGYLEVYARITVDRREPIGVY
jgi:tRNA-dihydrouridine synthase